MSVEKKPRLSDQAIRDRLHRRTEQFIRDLRNNARVKVGTDREIDMAFGAFLYVVSDKVRPRH